jgi:hypothetical protein
MGKAGEGVGASLLPQVKILTHAIFYFNTFVKKISISA